MDEERSAEALSRATGFWVDEIPLEGRDADREIMFSVYSPVHNLGCTIRLCRGTFSDPTFDVAEHIQQEVDRHLIALQAEKGHEGWQAKLSGARLAESHPRQLIVASLVGGPCDDARALVIDGDLFAYVHHCGKDYVYGLGDDGKYHYCPEIEDGS